MKRSMRSLMTASALSFLLIGGTVAEERTVPLPHEIAVSALATARSAYREATVKVTRDRLEVAAEEVRYKSIRAVCIGSCKAGNGSHVGTALLRAQKALELARNQLKKDREILKIAHKNYDSARFAYKIDTKNKMAVPAIQQQQQTKPVVPSPNK